MTLNGFSLSRWIGIVVKEFTQLKRDRLTFGMIIGIPVVQLILFGFAINSDPKHLPAAILAQDNSVYSRTLTVALQNSGYFRIVEQADSEERANRLLELGEVQFVIT
ncbi:MAG: ABC transporter permease, partial [Burkholderiales bacterium]